jgi:hypothetical protein
MVSTYLSEVIESSDSKVRHTKARGRGGSAGLVKAGEASLKGSARRDTVADTGSDDDAGASEHLAKAGRGIERELACVCMLAEYDCDIIVRY